MGAGTDLVESRVNILLIDDDPSFASLCERYLRTSDSQVGYGLTVVDNATEALTECEFNQFDCLVVDYRLAEHTGTEVISMLKQRFGELLGPCIVMTADGGEVAAIEAIRAGANDFLTKRELTREALQRAVDNAVEKGRLRRSITERRKELSDTNDMLSRRNHEIQRFYHNLSHELKTPLTAIREYISIVHDGLAGNVVDEQKKLLNYAILSCEQLRTQFDDLLDLARMETGRMSMSFASVSIGSVLERCALVAKKNALSKGLELLVECDEDAPSVLIDENRMVQVVGNLLDNAIKHTDYGGSVCLSAAFSATNQTIKVSITDTGCGIAPEHCAQVFDRLFQVSTPDLTNTPSGMGIGLSIAAEIAAAHNARIQVDSVLGKGSTFWFELPIKAAAELKQAG